MSNPHLLLPQKIWAVAGREINIYFRNIIPVVNFANYAFEVSCAKGRLDSERWRWIPQSDEIGSHPIKITVWSDSGVEAVGESEIIVAPADAGVGKKFSLLCVGASCTVAKGHGEALFERFQRPGNPQLTMLGSQAPGYQKPQLGGPAVEAYGGWNWDTFFTKDKVENTENADGLHPRRAWDVPSPFLFCENGKSVFDFPRYIETVCHGVIPDYFLFELGVNGLFLCKDDTECGNLLSNRIAPYMQRMLEAFKKVAPDAGYGVVLIPTGSWSQDAFGANYGCQQSRRRWLLNADFLSRFYLTHAAEWGYECVPAYLNVDGNANYPVKIEPRFEGSSEMIARPSNALHASDYGQWSDMEYFYLKNQWSKLK